MGTKEGSRKVKLALLKRFNGDEAALHKWRQEIGAKGGQAGRGHKFAHGKITPGAAGRLGGKVRRGKTYAK